MLNQRTPMDTGMDMGTDMDMGATRKQKKALRTGSGTSLKDSIQ